MQISDLWPLLAAEVHDAAGGVHAVGRLPQAVDAVLLDALEPEAAPANTIVLAPAPERGPALAIGDAALAHPAGLLAHIAQELHATQDEAVGPGRLQLRKLTVFVPESHLEAVRSAITAAGAGRVGRYADCTFTLHGEGAFRPLPGAHPFVGRPGKLERVDEARIEAVFPPYREAAIIAALRAAHPYEEIAYDLVELRNPDPTYGALRLCTIPAAPANDVLRQVLEASGSKRLFALEARGSVERLLIGRGDLLASQATLPAADLAIVDHIPYATALALRRKAVRVAELRDLDACALHHLAARLQAVLPIPVRDASEGLTWQECGNPKSTDRS